MITEFPERMQRLLAGPMWSGCSPQDIRDPLKVGVNNNVFRRQFSVFSQSVCDTVACLIIEQNRTLEPAIFKSFMLLISVP